MTLELKLALARIRCLETQINKLRGRKSNGQFKRKKK